MSIARNFISVARNSFAMQIPHKRLIKAIQIACKDAGAKYGVEIFCEGEDKETAIQFGPSKVPVRQFKAGFPGLDEYAKKIAEAAAMEAARRNVERAEIVNVRLKKIAKGKLMFTNFGVALV